MGGNGINEKEREWEKMITTYKQDLPQNGCTRAELYFLFYFYFFHSTSLCSESNSKLFTAYIQDKIKFEEMQASEEDKLQPAGWPVCGMNSVKLYTVDRDGPHVHP